jgi:hypothetical protein
MQAPVWILFACAVANRDVLFVVYEVPSVSICRGSQRMKAAQNLGLPPHWLADIEAYGGCIPECNAIRAGLARTSAGGGHSNGGKNGVRRRSQDRASSAASAGLAMHGSGGGGGGSSAAANSLQGVYMEEPGAKDEGCGDVEMEGVENNNVGTGGGGADEATPPPRPGWAGSGGAGRLAAARPEPLATERSMSMRLPSLASSFGSGLLSDHGACA